MSSDYTTVGHVTADVMADGSRRAGGGAFYSALQASRLGARARIVTRGVRAEIEQLLSPYRGEFELQVDDAPQTTTLQTTGTGRARTQRMLAWAGEISAETSVNTEILHVAPVARETSARWNGHARFVGLTPQGLVRSWSRLGAAVTPAALDRARVPEHCDAIVFSSSERDTCATLLPRGGEGAGAGARNETTSKQKMTNDTREATSERDTCRAVIAVTDAAAPTALYMAGGECVHVPVALVAHPRDDMGAGDVFAAAFFVSLADGATPQAAATFANAAAAVRLGGDGASAVGDRAAIEARAGAFS